LTTKCIAQLAAYEPRAVGIVRTFQVDCRLGARSWQKLSLINS
jgi:hypothetical protein